MTELISQLPSAFIGFLFGVLVSFAMTYVKIVKLAAALDNIKEINNKRDKTALAHAELFTKQSNQLATLISQVENNRVKIERMIDTCQRRHG